MNGPALDASLREQVLVDLSLWLSRVLQYSPEHPACAQLGEKTHRTVVRALSSSTPLSYGVLKDEIMIDGAPAKHPLLRSRIAPHLHGRGVLFLRFSQGVTVQELTQLIGLLALPEQTIYDRGGLARLATDRQIARVQIEEIAHDISIEERDAQQQRQRYRQFFRDMLRTTLSKRRPDASLAERIVELLEHPEIAVTLLEEDEAGIAEAAGGLALIVEQQEHRGVAVAAAKLVPVFLGLAPKSRVGLLLGFPALAGDFRRALARVFDAMEVPQLARLVFPSIRVNARELDATLYALEAIVPHHGTRYSALRLVGSMLFDLGFDDPLSGEQLTALASSAADDESFARERECLRGFASRAVERRSVGLTPTGSIPPEPFAHDGARTVADVIEIATRTRAFDRFGRKLASVAATMEGSSALGALRGLARAGTGSDETRLAAERTRRAVARAVAPRVLAELDGAANDAAGSELAQLTATVALFAELEPAAVLDRLDISESRTFRRILLDACASPSTEFLSLLRPRLRSSKWYVVRNAVILLARAGGTGDDLLPIANHPREQVRREIVRALRNIRDAAAMEIVIGYLTDPVAEISGPAPSLLRGELLGPAGIARLEAIATNESHGEDLRRRVVLALGRSSRDEAAAALLRILQPKGFVDLGSGTLRDVAASALRHSPAPSARGYFDQGLRSSSFRVRKACERALEQK